jgi:ankyrin repeat protein
LLEHYAEAATVIGRDGMLPFHYAVKSMSLSALGLLYEANPDAVSVRDAQGRLPLHHCAEILNDPAIIQFLHSKYPQGISISGGKYSRFGTPSVPLYVALLHRCHSLGDINPKGPRRVTQIQVFFPAAV